MIIPGVGFYQSGGGGGGGLTVIGVEATVESTAAVAVVVTLEVSATINPQEVVAEVAPNTIIVDAE